MSNELQVINENTSSVVVAPVNPMDLEPAVFASGLQRRKANREVLMDWIRSALVENTDYGSIPTKRGPSKPSLWKPGAEKICGMLNVTVTFPTLVDYEAAALAGKKLESLIIRCELISPGGAIIASGVGSRSVEQDYGDLNKALKMACKSAHIDATLRMGGLSEVFTQDLENGLPDEPPRSPVARPAPPAPQRPAPPVKASPAAKPAAPAATPTATPAQTAEALRKFLAACKARLLALVVPDDEWAWWRYAVDKGWIMTNESLVDSTADKMFEGYDPKNIKSSIGLAFDAHCSAVSAMAANCPPELRDEIVGGFIPMPRPAAEMPLATPKDHDCPACQSTATAKHDDMAGVRWCKSCGMQWQDGSTVAYEEHDWQWAKLPFAPKDPAKKSYKGMTLGQLGRIDNRYFFGIAMNFKAEPFNGRPPSAESVKFGEACEAARKYLESQKADAPRKPSEDSRDHAEDDQIPF